MRYSSRLIGTSGVAPGARAYRAAARVPWSRTAPRAPRRARKVRAEAASGLQATPRPGRPVRQSRTTSSLCHLSDFEAEGLEPVAGLFRGVAARERSGAHARLLALLALDVLGIALDACGSRPLLHLLRVVRVGKGAERYDKPLVVQQRLGAASLGHLGLRALFVRGPRALLLRSARPGGGLGLGLCRSLRRIFRGLRRFTLLRRHRGRLQRRGKAGLVPASL